MKTTFNASRFHSVYPDLVAYYEANCRARDFLEAAELRFSDLGAELARVEETGDRQLSEDLKYWRMTRSLIMGVEYFADLTCDSSSVSEFVTREYFESIKKAHKVLSQVMRAYQLSGDTELTGEEIDMLDTLNESFALAAMRDIYQLLVSKIDEAEETTKRMGASALLRRPGMTYYLVKVPSAYNTVRATLTTILHKRGKGPK